MSRSSNYKFSYLKTRWAAEDQSFGVYVCKFMNSPKISILSGSLAFTNLDPGDLYSCDAKEKLHPKFGLQLDLVSGPYNIFEESYHYQNTLLSEVINKGVSFSTFRGLLGSLHEAVVGLGFTWDTYPNLNLLSLSDQNSNLYLEMGAFSLEKKKMLEAIYGMVQRNKLIKILGSVGVPTKTVRQFLLDRRDTLYESLRTNPWEVSILEEIGLECADNLAKQFNISFERNKDRAKAIVVCALKDSMQNGDHFLHLESAITGLKDNGYSNENTDFFISLAKDIHKDEYLVLDKEPDTNRWLVYLKSIYDAEVFLAKFIKRYCTPSFQEEHFNLLRARLVAYSGLEDITNVSNEDICKKCLEVWQNKNAIELNPHQVEGVVSALKNPLMVICGLPGTGKTTMLKAVSSILNESRVALALMAPTGMASKRLEAATGLVSKTIHRTLGASGESSLDADSESYSGKTKSSAFSLEVGGSNWTNNIDNPHSAECFIVDESSMLSTPLCVNIIEALGKHSKVVFVGDAAQLPPVGPGDFLNNLITLDLVPHIALSKIYRQDEASDIVKIAHSIQEDNIKDCAFLNIENIRGDYDFSQQFKFLASNNEDEILRIMLKYAKKLWDAVQAGEVDSFQIISPRHLGKLGVTNLNKELRNLLNPPQASLKEVKLGADILREGDRIMVIKNDTEQDVYNGDMGKVLFLDLQAKIATVKIFRKDSLFITIPFNKIAYKLRLAYAVTVHKVQGQEFDVILFPIVQSFGKFIQRNLIYTALTRAKVSALFLGDILSFFTACDNDKEIKRKTLLMDRAKST